MLNKLLLNVFLFCALPFAEKVILKTVAQDSPPKYFLEFGKMKGLEIEILEAISNENPNIQFKGYNSFLPFARLIEELRQSNLDVFFGLRYTTQRDSFLNFISEPLYDVNYKLIMNKGDSLLIKNLDDIRKLKEQGLILCLNGTSTPQILDSKGGLIYDDSGADLNILLKMLANKRGRFVFYHELGLSYIMNTREFRDQFILLDLVIEKEAHWVAFSKLVSHSTITLVNEALKKLKSNGTIDRIVDKYKKPYPN